MPGIVGLITRKPRRAAECELLQMVDTLRHETFYKAGTWINESLGVYAGWVVRQNSFSDAMPVSNERKDVTLVFEGEEYPEPETIRGLKARGHSIGADGAAYLVHLYEEDPSFLVGLNGMFHGLLTDQARGTATLFNDRFGMHRIYYHQSKEAFYFAAEAKAILKVCPELRTADPRGLAEFIACGCVLENRTLFDGIQVLPGASAWTFSHGALEAKRTYFHPREWEEQTPLDAESYYQQLREVSARNLPRYFNGHERIGVALTGGLDTRLIMASRKAAPRSLPCYTFGSMFRDNQDVHVARKVAQACGQTHQAIVAGQDFLARFPHYAERSMYLTDGCIDLTRTPDLYVSEQARDIAPVKIVGTYGSEVLTLAPTFKPTKLLPGLFDRQLLDGLRQAEVTYAALREQHPLTFAAFRQSPWAHYGVLSLEQTQLTVRSPYLDNDFIRTAYLAPLRAGANRDVRQRLIADEDPALARIPTDRGLGGHSGRISGALSRAILEFTYKAEYAYDYGMPQSVARIDHLLSALQLERLFLGRHKMFHFRLWYRNALSAYVRDMLLDSRALSRPYLNRQRVEAIVAGHLSGTRNYTTEIHKLLALELQHRLFFDARPGGGL